MNLGSLEQLELFAKFADVLPDVLSKDLTPCMPYVGWISKHLKTVVSMAEQAKGIGRGKDCPSVDASWFCAEMRQTIGEPPPPGIERCLLQFTDVVAKWTELKEDCVRDLLSLIGRCVYKEVVTTVAV